MNPLAVVAYSAPWLLALAAALWLALRPSKIEREVARNIDRVLAQGYVDPLEEGFRALELDCIAALAALGVDYKPDPERAAREAREYALTILSGHPRSEVGR